MLNSFKIPSKKQNSCILLLFLGIAWSSECWSHKLRKLAIDWLPVCAAENLTDKWAPDICFMQQN